MAFQSTPPKGRHIGPKGRAKVAKVMGEHKAGKLHSGSGATVKDRKQAVAIALSEGRKTSRAGKRKKG